MAEPPKIQHMRVSHADLDSLYDKHGFEEKIATCRREDICPRRRYDSEDTKHASTTEFKEGAKFRDPITDDPVAVIFWYTDIFGNIKRSIEMLRIGDVIHDAKLRPR